MENKDELNMIYHIMQINYIEAMGRTVSSDGSNNDLFPSGWFSDEDYMEKIEILNEAIDKKTLIINTELYQENIEGVRSSR